MLHPARARARLSQSKAVANRHSFVYITNQEDESDDAAAAVDGGGVGDLGGLRLPKREVEEDAVEAEGAPGGRGAEEEQGEATSGRRKRFQWWRQTSQRVRGSVARRTCRLF